MWVQVPCAVNANEATASCTTYPRVATADGSAAHAKQKLTLFNKFHVVGGPKYDLSSCATTRNIFCLVAVCYVHPCHPISPELRVTCNGNSLA